MKCNVYTLLTLLLCFEDTFGRPRGKPEDATESKDQKASRRRQCGVVSNLMYKLVKHGSRPKWDKSDLTFTITKFHEELDHAHVIAVMQQAFDLWSQHIPLKFSYDPLNAEANIEVRFERGPEPHAHRDGALERFDGEGKELAHASFPRPLKGSDLHFDADERWFLQDAPTKDVDEKDTSFFQIAVHEIGHTLGLDHTWDDKAVMSSTYTYRYPFQLTASDIGHCQSLYGLRKKNDTLINYTKADRSASSVPDKSIAEWWKNMTENRAELERNYEKEYIKLSERQHTLLDNVFKRRLSLDKYDKRMLGRNVGFELSPSSVPLQGRRKPQQYPPYFHPNRVTDFHLPRQLINNVPNPKTMHPNAYNPNQTCFAKFIDGWQRIVCAASRKNRKNISGLLPFK